MDLKELDTRAGAEAGFALNLLHPGTGEPTGIILNLRGADSETYQEVKRDLARQRLNEVAARRGPARVSADNLDQADEDELVLLASATKGWECLQENGVDLVFTAKEAQRIYKKYPWIREQADAAIHRRANFLPKTAKS